MPAFIDSHVHLWPATAANAQGHAWMKAVPSLAKEQIVDDYLVAVHGSGTTPHSGPKSVYIETDRRYEYDPKVPLSTWANGPLDEIRFLRSIVEDKSGHSDILAGIVLWAPVDRGIAVFDEWLSLAEVTAGPAMWQRVKGFRYLLQAITCRDEFERLVLSEGFTQIMCRMGEKGFAFDVGIDQYRGGTWQLEVWAAVLKRVRETGGRALPTFIMNHLCKPDMIAGTRGEGEKELKAWQACIEQFAGHPNVYMKLSGAFSELSDERVNTRDVKELADRIRPWTDTVLDAFGADRVMFGSDWPVCNIRGPGMEQSWGIWHSVVLELCEARHFDQQSQQDIFAGTAIRAYKLDS